MTFLNGGKMLVKDAGRAVMVKDENLCSASVTDVLFRDGTSGASEARRVERESVARERGAIAEHHDFNTAGRGEDIRVLMKIFALTASGGEASGFGACRDRRKDR
jgi:hypothetical protein